MLKHFVAATVAVLVLVVFAPYRLACNKAGHMVSAAIAYSELKPTVCPSHDSASML
jgi:hypothetical protein